MPRCEICDEVVNRVYTCKECGTKFCEECGDTQNRICLNCLEEPEKEEKPEEEMPICEICGEEVDEVYTCKECETVFCAECGDPKKKLCNYCLEEEEEPL